jgi:hypothetical protein
MRDTEALKEAIAKALKERATTWGGLTEWPALAEAALEVMLADIELNLDEVRRLHLYLEEMQAKVDGLHKAAIDNAATIRRLTEERLGPEKPLYEQLKDRGLIVTPAHGHEFKPAETNGVMRLRCTRCNGLRTDMLKPEGGVYPCKGAD